MQSLRHDQARKRRILRLGYPCREFWQIAAAEGCRAVIGFDAHRPQQLAELTHYSAARSMLEELGIPIVEELSLV